MVLPATPLEAQSSLSQGSLPQSSPPRGAPRRALAFDPDRGNSLRLDPQKLTPAWRAAAGALKTAAELQSALDFRNAERVLSLGVPALDAVLPQGGLPQGSVVELQVHGASGAATSLALCACRAAQSARDPLQGGPLQHPLRRQARREPRQRDSTEPARPWCAFIDPGASLFAPGVARLGVDLSRLLVIRPEPEAVERVAIRIAEAKAVSLLVIDWLGARSFVGARPPGATLPPGTTSGSGVHAPSSLRWQRAVRRLALAIKQLGTTILLLTPAEPRPSLPLPVAMRLELSRATAEGFELRVGKERSGRVSSARSIPWSALEPALPARGWH